MSYQFLPGQMYRMPTHFGPATGPRRGPDGRTFDCIDNPKSTAVSVTFRTNAQQLQDWLPPGFELRAEPIVTVTANYMKEIEWLAGRGYATLGLTFPTRYVGTVDRVNGNLLAVLWENLTDPIITGREELGFSKIYCELPEPAVLRNDYHCIASWLGFKFMDLRAFNLRELATGAAPPFEQPQSEGTLHYKYMPRTGEWGTSEAAYALLTPQADSNNRVLRRWHGEGSVHFHKARWEDLPTQYMIVNAFAELEVVESLGATVTQSVGGKDLSDQRILT